MLSCIHIHIKIYKYLFNEMNEKKARIISNLYPTLPPSLGPYKVDFFLFLIKS